MPAYYPFGKPIRLTNEQMADQEKKYALYEKYGIPCGIFDDITEYSMHELDIELDRNEASLLIMQGKEIPKDLEKRLFQYKKEDEIRKSKEKQTV